MVEKQQNKITEIAAIAYYSARNAPGLILPNINGQRLKFEKGVLQLSDSETIDALDGELARNNVLRSKVSKIDVAGAEAVSKAFQASTQRETAFKGAMTSEIHRAQAQEMFKARDAQLTGTVTEEGAVEGLVKQDADTAAKTNPLTFTTKSDQPE